MHGLNHIHHLHHIVQRAPEPRVDLPHPPLQQVDDMHSIPGLVRRSPDATSSSSKATRTCNADNANLCEKPHSSNALPIALGAAIPLVCALVVLIFLHRRNKKKQRLDDEKDPHKSLDFGMGDVPAAGTGKKGKGGMPEMSAADTEQTLRRGRGLSMDLGNSPYLLPAGLHGSRESVRSMSRSHTDPNDPYRPITFVKGDDTFSRSQSRQAHDNGSVFTASSGGTERMNASLVRNAKRMSQSFPTRGDSKATPEVNPIQYPQPVAKPPANTGLAPAPSTTDRDSYYDRNAKELRKNNNYLGAFIYGQEPSVAPTSPVDSGYASSEPTLSSVDVLQSQQATVHKPDTTSFISETSDYGDALKITPPSPPQKSSARILHVNRRSIDAPSPVPEEAPARGLGVQGLDYDPHRLSMSVRPLPEFDPTENPEERANRIRSFYKDRAPVQHTYGDYYEDYGQEYQGDGTVFDPQSGNFVAAQRMPYAQPVTRRAMTPPPRAPPRFRGPQGHLSTGSSKYGPSSRGQSAMSNYSTAKKPVPPPAPLATLPTPHMLKEDSMVFSPIDFAPPASYRDRQAGRRPDSPLGGQRQYSPVVRAHTPLASSFDDLAVMPSPHMLRNSSTFTALDFAPQPRFKNADPGSDASSIRSGRSNMNPVQLNSLRAGAYRVSRIPKGVVGTKNDLMSELKPKWDMRDGAVGIRA
ncbi:hypothetical protein H2199_004837 [Coniosporium tulheliwenetii]|uniref:Uncharacterized protein n=1 Tax=Coniosporium tulheliwenetii TaxID=3383036 RepID=A0ACC2Z554_9PEZI|nr:hypothetical protein H2199_004837 [Cladosporium sp. JES 115]